MTMEEARIIFRGDERFHSMINLIHRDQREAKAPRTEPRKRTVIPLRPEAAPSGKAGAGAPSAVERQKLRSLLKR